MLSGLKMEIGAANTINKQKMRCLDKQVTRFQNKILNHYISNRLKHPLLNSYFDNLSFVTQILVEMMWSQFREYKEIGTFGSKYSPAVSPVFLQQPFSTFSVLYRLPQSKHRTMKNGILYFLLFSSDHLLALNSLFNQLKFTLSTNSSLICLLHFKYTSVIIEWISSFSKQKFSKILFHIRKLVNAYAAVTKPLFFTVNVRNLIFAIKIFAAIQYFWKLQCVSFPSPNYSNLCYSVKVQAYTWLDTNGN